MKDQVNELLLQAVETEMGGVQIYQTALGCAINADLKEEWEKYLDQTKRHVEVVSELCDKLGVRTRAQLVKVALEQYRDQL